MLGVPKTGGPIFGRFPCLRYKITDIKFYYPGEVPGNEWTRRWNKNSMDSIHGLCNKYIEI